MRINLTEDIDYRGFPVFGLDELVKNQEQRAAVINNWKCNGGVLIIGYETFRILVTRKKNQIESQREKEINEALLDPGPQLVICDEGHRIKNENAQVINNLNILINSRQNLNNYQAFLNKKFFFLLLESDNFIF